MAVDKRATRLGVLALVGVILFGVVGARLWFLQAVQAEELQAQVNTTKLRTVPLLPERGRIFDAEQCFPASRSLALGDPAITLGLLGIPVWVLSGDPILTLNVVTLAVNLLAALAMFWLVRDWTGVPAAGIAAGRAPLGARLEAQRSRRRKTGARAPGRKRARILGGRKGGGTLSQS